MAQTLMFIALMLSQSSVLDPYFSYVMEIGYAPGDLDGAVKTLQSKSVARTGNEDFQALFDILSELKEMQSEYVRTLDCGSIKISAQVEKKATHLTICVSDLITDTSDQEFTEKWNEAYKFAWGILQKKVDFVRPGNFPRPIP